MKTWEYWSLIFPSVILAMIQSLYVEGFFEFFGYIMWGVICLVYLTDVLIHNSKSKRGDE